MSTKLGVTLPQFGSDTARLIDAAQSAEEAGLDSIWVFDHLWPLTGSRDRPILEAWSTLAAVAAATSRISVGTLVTRSTLRHPALLAKMAGTVAAIAPGRLILGLGSGDNKSRVENEAFGVPYFSGTERTEQLRSTAEIFLGFWQDQVLSQEDDYVTISGLPPSPRNTGGRPELWIAGRGDEALSIAAELGDGWNGWSGSPKRLGRDAARVRDAAGGRPVTITWGGQFLLSGRDDAASQAELRKDPYLLWGGPDEVLASLHEYVAAGAEHLILTQVGPWSQAIHDELASVIAPALSEG